MRRLLVRLWELAAAAIIPEDTVAFEAPKTTPPEPVGWRRPRR